MDITFTVLVKQTVAPVIAKGNYVLEDRATGRLLTAHGSGNLVTFEEGDAGAPGVGQTWFIDTRNSKTYCLVSLPDSLVIGTNAKLSTLKLYSLYFEQAAGTDLYAMHTGSSAAYIKYWAAAADGSVDNSGTSLTGYPFRLIPAHGGETLAEGVQAAAEKVAAGEVYDLSGRRMLSVPRQKGIYIIGKKKFVSL